MSDGKSNEGVSNDVIVGRSKTSEVERSGWDVISADKGGGERILGLILIDGMVGNGEARPGLVGKGEARPTQGPPPSSNSWVLVGHLTLLTYSTSCLAESSDLVSSTSTSFSSSRTSSTFLLAFSPDVSDLVSVLTEVMFTSYKSISWSMQYIPLRIKKITKIETHFYLKRNTAIDWMVITCISKLQNLNQGLSLLKVFLPAQHAV